MGKKNEHLEKEISVTSKKKKKNGSQLYIHLHPHHEVLLWSATDQLGSLDHLVILHPKRHI